MGDQAVCISGRVTKGQAEAVVSYYVLVKAEEAPAQSKLSIGDYLSIGNYHGEAILWRCVDIDKNGALMLADQVLCVKPFDFPGGDRSGSHGRGYQNGRDRIRYGSNYWGDSNIRSWLNSDAGPGETVWGCANPPVSPNSLTMFNSYEQEAGFLNGFSQKDKSAVKKTTLSSMLDRYERFAEGDANYLLFDARLFSILQNYNTAFCEAAEEFIFLPDIKQINRIYQNSSLLEEGYYIGKLTQAAAREDHSGKTYPDDLACAYWLRTPSADGSRGYKTRIVCAQEQEAMVQDMNVGASIGVRPAFYFNDAAQISGNGTKEAPYTLQ